jgi:hypothetical protein
MSYLFVCKERLILFPIETREKSFSTYKVHSWVFQVFLYILLSHYTQPNSSGEVDSTVNLMILSASHISAELHLSSCCNLGSDLMSFIAMIGTLLLW